MFNTDYYTSRYFNEVRVINDLVIKSSTNKEKIQCEYSFYYHLPNNLKRYFVQPFDLHEVDNRSAYYMEHIAVPNVALLLLNNNLSSSSFNSLLSKLKSFLGECPINNLDVHQQSYQLVIAKTINRLSTYPEYKNSLVRLEKAYDLYKVERIDWVARLSHGDLCLSNILWIDSIEMMKLIDPRGASTAEDMYMDEYYDLAKLQHSIFSEYDAMLYGGGKVPTYAKEAFSLFLDGIKVSRSFLKVYEAALFLSMIPLHSESPSRMAKFYETANHILDELGV